MGNSPKGLYHKDISVLGYFCAEVITYSAFTRTQNASASVQL